MIAQLDLLRSKLLKETLKVSFLRYLFFNRAARLFTLFVLATTVYFFASLYFPLWVLLIGPIIYGVPHLISSLRFSFLKMDRNSQVYLKYFHLAAWSSVFLYRLCVDIFKIDLPLSSSHLLYEGLVLIAAFLVQFFLLKARNLKSLITFIGLVLLVAATHYYPIQTSLVLLVGHNFVALVPWYISCQKRSDKNVFFAGSAIFILLSIGIYNGAFDKIYSLLEPQGYLEFLNWDYSDVITPFLTDEMNYVFWFRMVVLYAFTQSIHYFIWMKAIPENHQKQDHPPSFNWSFNALRSDFGSVTLLSLLILTAAGFTMWLLFEFQTARTLYFALASYHGFMEISTLPFLTSKQVGD